MILRILPTHLNENGIRISDRSRNALLPLIIQHIRPGSISYSDQWTAYYKKDGDIMRNLETFPETAHLGYRHFAVNHSKHFVDPNNRESHTNTIEGIWSAKLKNYLKPLKGILLEDLPGYIDECILRSWITQGIPADNRKTIFYERFMKLLSGESLNI